MNRILLFWLFVASSQLLAAQLSDEEVQKVSQYVETLSVDESVGQLFMTGLPTDIAQYLHDNVVDELVKEMGIGWFELNSYNYYWNRKTYQTEDDLLSAIRSFYNLVQTSSRGANLKLPIGFAANFEGERISSINDLATEVPEALTISLTNRNDLAEQAGSLVGHELKQLGVHLLLGPVLDIDSIPNREYVTTIQNRTFGGSPETVTNAASQFLIGLKKNGVLAIGKHFPGHGGVLEDSHNQIIPESQMSLVGLDKSLFPYRVLQQNLDGVMTAHVAVNILKTEQNRIVTFSPVLVDQVLRKSSLIPIGDAAINGLGFGDKVAITDDLSDMGAIRQYMLKNKIDWKQVVIQAFESGHDMFLFSSIERDVGGPKFSNYGDMTIGKLKQIIEDFAAYIKSDPNNVQRFRASLRRVLLLKAKIAKARNQTTTDFLSGSLDHWTLGVDGLDELRSIPVGDSKKNANVVARSILDAGCVLLNKNADYMIGGDSNESQLSFFIAANGVETFRKRILDRFPKSNFYPSPIVKSFQAFNDLYSRLVDSLSKSDKVFISVASVDDARLVESALERLPKLAQDKLVVLLHNTPTLLNSSVVQRLTVLGTCSYHLLSYETDVDVILGKISPRETTNLTISIGPSGSVYDVNSYSTRFKLADGYTVIPFFATNLERELTMANSEKQNVIFWMLICFLILVSVFASVLVFVRIRSVKFLQPVVKVNGRFKRFLLANIGKNVTAVVGLILVVFVVAYFSIGLYAIKGDPSLLKSYSDTMPLGRLWFEQPAYGLLGFGIVGFTILVILWILLYFKNIRDIIRGKE